MKKTLMVALVLGLVAGSLGAPAEAGKKKKKKEFTVTSEYQAPAIGIGELGVGVCLIATNSCGNIATPDVTAKYLKMSIEDAAGLPVNFSIAQDTDPDAVGSEADLGTFCGDTGDESIIIDPTYPLTIFPWAVGGPSCPSIATTGTVTAIFSNRP